MVSFGGSHQGSWNQSTSDAGGYNRSGQESSSGQSVWGNQSGALNDLYAQAQGLMAGNSPYGAQAGAMGQAGMDAWRAQLVPGQNPYFDQAVQASIDQATTSFKRNVLPELDSRSAGVGQLGGSRDRLATGEATGLFGQGIAQSTAQQYANQYAGDQARALQAVSMTPQMMQGAYAPLAMALQMIGGPTVLSQSQSSGWGDAQNWATSKTNAGSAGGSTNFGILSKSGSK